MSSYVIVKAGWLHRESSILHRWKRNWFVLYANGELKYFESPDVYEAEESIFLPRQVIYTIIGNQCGDVAPPSGSKRDSLLTLCGYDDNRWRLCGESPDDARAWQISLEQARGVRRPQSAPPQPTSSYHPNMPYYPPPAYTAYHDSPYMYRTPNQGYPYQYPPTYVNENGERLVYVYDRSRRRDTDLATGMLAGAAVGSMLMWPLMWW